MKLLEERIRKDGTIRGTEVLKVDRFLNHQMDIGLINEIGKEFHRLFADCGVNKILTIEASGIGIACIAAQYFNVPVIFARRTRLRTSPETCIPPRWSPLPRQGVRHHCLQGVPGSGGPGPPHRRLSGQRKRPSGPDPPGALRRGSWWARASVGESVPARRRHDPLYRACGSSP